MKKLLACDVDGTLFHLDERISQDCLDAISEFRKQGHQFVLCTGRTINWVTPLFQHTSLEADGLILANGASLYTINSLNPLHFEKLYFNAIPSEIGVEIITYLYHEEKVMMYWGDGEHTYELHDRRLQFADSFELDSNDTVYISLQQYLDNPHPIVGFGTAPVNKDVKEAQRILHVIQQRWGDHINVAQNLFFVDIMVKSVSKGDGIKKYLDYCPQSYQCYGIGDSYNDEPMFRAVGKDHAFLMSNGAQDLAPLVAHRVDSVTQCIEILLKNNV